MHAHSWKLLLRRGSPWLPWTLLAIPLALITAGARDLPKALAETRAPTIRIAINHWPEYELLYAAQELELFRDEGIDVQIVEVASLADSMRALAHKEVDAIACTTVEAIRLTRDYAADVSIVYAFDASHGADVILAREDIDSLAQLRSRRVGVESVSLTTVMLQEGLSRAGLALTDVEQVIMDPSDMPAAMAAGRIDAAVCYPPVSIRILEQGRVAALFSSAEIPDTVIDVLAFDHAVLERRPDAVKAVLRATRRAAELARTRPNDVDPIMALRERLTVEQFRAALSFGVRRYSTQDQPSVLAPGGPVERSLSVTLSAIRRSETLPTNTNDTALPRVVYIEAEPSP